MHKPRFPVIVAAAATVFLSTRVVRAFVPVGSSAVALRSKYCTSSGFVQQRAAPCVLARGRYGGWGVAAGRASVGGGVSMMFDTLADSMTDIANLLRGQKTITESRLVRRCRTCIVGAHL